MVHPSAFGSTPSGSASAPSAGEADLIDALRAGDEAAFVLLVDRYQAGMMRLAMLYVKDRAVAEEVTQETWLSVLRGVHRFQARSSIKTWLFAILVNGARTRARREWRTTPFSALGEAADEPAEPALPPERFRPPDDPQWPGHWAPNMAPRSWGDDPEQRLLARETQSQLRQAIDALPASQRAVIVLRDVEGWTADEVCRSLQVTETNQRVLLHRARSRVRERLAQALAQ
jgi:RNA polymerase sigma-70 factor, ECF subfamily